VSDFEELLKLLEDFRDERDWGQFHDSKNLALALSIEAAELNELFLWKKEVDAEEVDPQRLREELADVFAYAIMLAGRHGLSINEIVKAKIEKNAKKYPVEKSRGNFQKHQQLKSEE
jgi:NTP pyrophosphatase (non-canonical NTP hydrolase)